MDGCLGWDGKYLPMPVPEIMQPGWRDRKGFISKSLCRRRLLDELSVALGWDGMVEPQQQGIVFLEEIRELQPTLMTSITPRTCSMTGSSR